MMVSSVRIILYYVLCIWMCAPVRDPNPTDSATMTTKHKSKRSSAPVIGLFIALRMINTFQTEKIVMNAKALPPRTIAAQVKILSKCLIRFGTSIVLITFFKVVGPGRKDLARAFIYLKLRRFPGHSKCRVRHSRHKFVPCHLPQLFPS